SKIAILVSEFLQCCLEGFLCLESAVIGAKPYSVPPEGDSSRRPLQLYTVISCKIGSERRHNRRFADHYGVSGRGPADLLFRDYALTSLVNLWHSRPGCYLTLGSCSRLPHHCVRITFVQGPND